MKKLDDNKTLQGTQKQIKPFVKGESGSPSLYLPESKEKGEQYRPEKKKRGIIPYILTGSAGIRKRNAGGRKITRLNQVMSFFLSLY